VLVLRVAGDLRHEPATYRQSRRRPQARRPVLDRICGAPRPVHDVVESAVMTTDHETVAVLVARLAGRR
jgi:hypothetical protein